MNKMKFTDEELLAAHNFLKGKDSKEKASLSRQASTKEERSSGLRTARDSRGVVVSHSDGHNRKLRASRRGDN